MARRIVSAAKRFATEWSLHDDRLPVELSTLHDAFEPVYEDLTELEVLGYGAFVDCGDSGAVGRVLIEQSLSEDDRRLVYAHEIGHFICGHLASPVTSEVNGWQHDRDEREAWLAAAVLLIPSSAVGWGENVDEVAAHCRVPAELVQMYHDAMVVRNG